MTNFKIFLTAKDPTVDYDYSFECGVADNKFHFDHHKVEHHYPAPCNNTAIKYHFLKSDIKIGISHLDADTLLGIERLINDNFQGKFNGIDLELIEKIDMNGSSCLSKEELSSTTYGYVVGVGILARELKFPRISSEEDIDVTNIVTSIFNTKISEIVEKGIEAERRSVADTDKATLLKKSNIALIYVREEANVNPSLPYREGIDIVVVFYERWKKISLYSNPLTKTIVKGNVGGIEFSGHDKACGSPRGEEFCLEDAIRIYEILK
jgi:hypothetical protein